MYSKLTVRDLAHKARSYGRGRDAENLFNAHLNEAFASKQLDYKEFGVRRLFEEFVPEGQRLLEYCDPRMGGRSLREAADLVDTSAFSNIIGQIFYNAILEGYSAPQFAFSQKVPTVDTRLSGEKIPGISQIGDEALEVGEGQGYPTVGLNEDYIQTPPTIKTGLIIPLTKEAIFFDRTNLLLERAGEIGEFLGLRKEKRIINAFADIIQTGFRYNWKGTTYGSYQSATPWINLKTSNGLNSWENINNAEQLLANMLDPNTGQPIMVEADTIVVPPALLHTARQIVLATEVRRFNLSSDGTRSVGTIGANPMTANPLSASNYEIIASRLYRLQMALSDTNNSTSLADTTWFLCNLKRMLKYMQNWPVTVTQAPQNSEAEFTQDIVVRFKATERGTPAVVDPRYAVQNNA